jgi:hypothetical protein
MRKYCRICWNTKYWRQPTGEARYLERKSFVRKHGFGHEEWLFNFAWLQRAPKARSEKFKYGFLQPIGKYRSAYEGTTLDILLYTVSPDSERVAVGEIKDLLVPELPELRSAMAELRRNGWLQEMRNDLSHLGLASTTLSAPAEHVINVRFKPSQAIFYDPPIPLPRTHKTYRIPRYQPLDWDDDFVPATAGLRPVVRRAKSGKRRSEAERTRAAIKSTTYDPRHVILQNALYDHLCDVYGKSVVNYEYRDEYSFVDLVLRPKNEVWFFEIKMAPTAKSCIRDAIGQLLEYGIYPDQQRASKLLVVGDGRPDKNDVLYISHLRAKFKLPIYYRRWDPQRNLLEDEV